MNIFERLREQEQRRPLLRRANLTCNFLENSLHPPSKILDLGTPNYLSNKLLEKGYIISNTEGKDFDSYPEQAGGEGFDAVTAFEILEHLINPMGVLRAIMAPRLFTSVPLRLWFSKAYCNHNDPWDRHYHEFEDWQFDWLLDKSGWRIVRSAKWTNPTIKVGIRPIFRLFTPRYYIVEATKK